MNTGTTRPEDFGRPDLDPAREGVAGDRYDDFRAAAAADMEYRRAYAKIAAVNPAAAVKLPHPDARDTDPVTALELIRKVEGTVKIQADPAADLKG